MVLARVYELYRKGGLGRITSGIADSARYWAKSNCPGLLGKFVELRGNKVSYRGVTLDLSDPVIGRRLKARFPLGIYETAEVELIEEWIPNNNAVVELGGGIGFVSCVTDENINEVPHVVIEANPELIDIIETNRKLNNARFDVSHAAYQSSNDMVEFYVHEKICWWERPKGNRSDRRGGRRIVSNNCKRYRPTAFDYRGH